jgi:hypothetical protein
MKKVAIVGANGLTRGDAPFDDKSYEIWSFADWICSPWLKRCNGLMEIHLPNVYMNHPRTPEYWSALQTIEFPVWMYPIADPQVPGSVLYPLDGVLSLVSKGKQNGKDFQPLNCSVAYAIGLAIHLKYDVIDVYGVELNAPSEYGNQIAHFSFWNGVALGRGIELNINCSDNLFVQPLYGFEDVTERQKIWQMIEKIRQDKKEAHEAELMNKGAEQALQFLLNK